ncbi:MAG: ankyrin repeat domain-containing protein [Victivallaceae bacterium]
MKDKLSGGILLSWLGILLSCLVLTGCGEDVEDVYIPPGPPNAQLLSYAGKGDIRYVKYIIVKLDADVNAKDPEHGLTALQIAAMKNYTDIAKYLIEKGADVNTRSVTGFTPLHTAAMFGSTQVGEILLEKGADVNAATADSLATPLICAAQNGHSEMVRLLLENGADIKPKNSGGEEALGFAYVTCDRPIWLDIISRGGCISDFGLLLMAQKESQEVLAAVLKNGSNINAQSQGGESLLSIVIGRGMTAYAKELIARKATPTPAAFIAAIRIGAKELYPTFLASIPDIDATDAHGTTPLIAAVAVGDLDLVNELLQKGADITICDVDGISAMALAEKTNNPEILRALVKQKIAQLYGNDLNKKVNSEEQTPLIEAITSNKELEAEILLEMNADPNIPDNFGDTPLIHAALQRNQKMVELLLKNNANIEIKDNSGQTALSAFIDNLHSVTQADIDFAEFLVKSGADPKILDQADAAGTPFTITLLSKCPNAVLLSIDLGANINATDADGNTALLEAVSYGNLRLTEFLLRRNAALNISNKRGQTAADIAISKRMNDPAQNLIMNGSLVSMANFINILKSGNTQLVETLVKNGMPVDSTFIDRWGKEVSIVGAAFASGNSNLVALMADKGGKATPAEFNEMMNRLPEPILIKLVQNGTNVSIDASDSNEYSLLMRAIKFGYCDLAKVMIDKGANINEDGYTPLMLACDTGNIDMVKLLLDKGVDINAEMCGTALTRACQKNNLEIVKLLWERGANPNVRSSAVSPLTWASGNGNAEMVRLLLNAKSDVNSRVRAPMIGYPDQSKTDGFDRRGATPLDVATTQEVADILRKAGGKTSKEIAQRRR